MESAPVPRGMRMVIDYVKKQNPHVENVDTEMLNQWLKENIASTSSKMAAAEMDGKSVQQQPQRPKVVLLDVRPENEFEVGCIPLAHRVDPEERNMNKVLQLINEIAPAKEPEKRVAVVMYCSVGYRSSILVNRLNKFLKKEGEESAFDVYNLEGSIFKWANEDRKMIDKTGQETKYVHPYSMIWCHLLDRHRRKYKL